MRSGIVHNFRLRISMGMTCLVFLVLAQWAVAQTAHYSITLDVTWSEVTHPTDVPAGAHLSGLVGGTHDATVSFWDTGALASLGIKRMAEWGNQTELLAEVQAAIDAGQAETTIADDPLWTVPGTTGVAIQLTPEYPLVTLVAMVAPSPDWFLGVRNLDLNPGGVWVEELVIDVFPYDAGTDSGIAYTSPDLATVPPDPIMPINGYPFAMDVPLGTLTFTKQYVTAVPEAVIFQATAYPNPFNPQTTIAWNLPAAGALKVNIFDTRGRMVRSLRDGPAQAGPGSVSWDGRDDSGLQVGTGVYFAHLAGETASRTTKITLVK